VLLSRWRISGLGATLLVALAVPVAADVPVVTVGTRYLLLKDDSVPPISPNARKLSFAARTKYDPPEHQVIAPAPGSAGDPTSAGLTGGGAVLTIYDTAGSGEQVTYLLPAERWHFQGNPAGSFRYVFADDPAVAPVWKIWVKTYKLTVRGGHAQFGYTLDEPSQGRIGVRLTLGSGVTWCTDAPAQAAGTPPSTAKYDHVDKFQARAKSPAPAVCPPQP
jgi:hypothetical protein